MDVKAGLSSLMIDRKTGALIIILIWLHYILMIFKTNLLPASQAANCSPPRGVHGPPTWHGARGCTYTCFKYTRVRTLYFMGYLLPSLSIFHLISS